MATVHQELAQLTQELPRLAGCLSEVLLTAADDSAQPGAVFADTESAGVLGALRQLLESDAMEAQHHFQAHRAELALVLKPGQMVRLAQSIDRFNYDEALALLDQLDAVP